MKENNFNHHNYFEDFVKDLSRLIEIPSYLEEGTSYPNADLKKVLQVTLEVAKKFGFETYLDSDGYYGYAEVGSGELFGVLGHLDVVPPGDTSKWNSAPFSLERKEGKLIGRGTQDNKGPSLAAMYSLKMLLDSGYELKKRVRFIFGTDEESLWRGITKYAEKEEMPKLGFTPDSKFPLIYAEKGLLQCKLKGKSNGLKLKGGDAFNSVASTFLYQLEYQETFIKSLKANNFDFKVTDEGVEVIGSSVHAQMADKGVNAIVRSFVALKKSYPQSMGIKFVTETFGEDANARAIFGDVADEHSGKLMFNLGKVDFDENKEELSIDIRIPVTCEKDFVVNKLVEVAKKYDLVYEEYDWLKSIYLPLESELIQSLMKSYQMVTGDMVSTPQTSGGATYARAMDNCVAFGAVFPGAKKTEHQPNEYITEKDIKRAVEVYYEAFKNLV